MKFLKTLLKEQKYLEADTEFDQFVSDNNISDLTVIHTLVFSKDAYENETEVREYLSDKYVWDPAIIEVDNDFVASLIQPSQIDSETTVEVEIRRGVTAHAGELVPINNCEDMCFNDKGEINLSTKFNTIDLSEGIPFVIEIAKVSKGVHPNYGEIDITQSILKSMQSNFESKVTGVDLAINEDHLKNEAFGWLKDVFLSFDEQTLFGQVVWNTKGTTALAEKEYRYFSPEFRFNYEHPHTLVQHGPTLLGGALTNYPFLKMDAIVELSSKQKKQIKGDEQMPKENTVDLAVHEGKLLDLSTKNSELQGKLNLSESKVVELSSKNEKLENEAKQKGLEVANQKLFDGGLINAAQLVALNEGKSSYEVFALSEKMNTEGKGSTNNDSEIINLSAEEKSFAKRLGLSDEEFKAGNE